MFQCYRSSLRSTNRHAPPKLGHAPSAPALLFLCPRWFRNFYQFRQNLAGRRCIAYTSEPHERSATFAPRLLSTAPAKYNELKTSPQARPQPPHADDRITIGSISSTLAQNSQEKWGGDAAVLRVDRTDPGTQTNHPPGDEGESYLNHNGDAPIRTKATGKIAKAKTDTSPKPLPIDWRTRKPVLDWKYLLDVLSRAAVKPDEEPGVRITLKERTIFELTGSLSENSWIHRAKDGCRIHVLPRNRQSKDGCREVVLHSSNRGQELTSRYLLEYEKQLPTQILDNSRTKERHVKAIDPVDPIKHTLRADQIPPPKLWTVRSFADQVEKLVKSKSNVPRTVLRALYPGRQEPILVIARELELLFADPRLRDYVSSRAIKLALFFTNEHPPIKQTSDMLFQLATEYGLYLPIAVYNSLIEVALKRNDLTSFEHLIVDMRHAGINPDGMTWVKFLKHQKDPYARRMILSRLGESGFLDREEVVGSAVAALTRVEFKKFLGSRQSLRQAVQLMDLGFGEKWLSTEVLGKLINTGRKGSKWNPTSDIFDLAISRKIALKKSTLNYVLYYLRRRGSLVDATALLSAQIAKDVGLEYTSAISNIFGIAWHKGFLNVCRVMWHAGATTGHISYEMQSLVSKRLFINHNVVQDGLHLNWRHLASHLIVSSDLYPSGCRSRFPLLAKRLPSPTTIVQWLGFAAADAEQRKEQIDLAYLIVQHDLALWKRYKPMKTQTFLDLLHAAYDLDRRSTRRQFPMPRRLSERLQDMIKIPLVLREEPLKFDNMLSTASLSASVLVRHSGDSGRTSTGPQNAEPADSHDVEPDDNNNFMPDSGNDGMIRPRATDHYKPQNLFASNGVDAEPETVHLDDADCTRGGLEGIETLGKGPGRTT